MNKTTVKFSLYHNGQCVDEGIFDPDYAGPYYPQSTALELAEDYVFETLDTDFGENEIDRYIGEGEDFGNGKYQFVVRIRDDENIDEAVTVNLEFTDNESR